MKQLFAISFAALLGLLAGCGATGPSGNGNSTGSGITVFGTIDAGVTGSKSR
jgi:hypothetical protein